jgi:hypothetical protein
LVQVLGHLDLAPVQAEPSQQIYARMGGMQIGFYLA